MRTERRGLCSTRSLFPIPSNSPTRPCAYYIRSPVDCESKLRRMNSCRCQPKYCQHADTVLYCVRLLQHSVTYPVLYLIIVHLALHCRVSNAISSIPRLFLLLISSSRLLSSLSILCMFCTKNVLRTPLMDLASLLVADLLCSVVCAMPV